jgi:hypothetical protein
MIFTKLRLFSHASLLLVGACVFNPTSIAADTDLNKAKVLNTLMLRQIDQGAVNNIIPISSDNEAARKLARVLLNNLSNGPEYQRYLDNWIAAHPTVIIDELYEEWMKNYHDAFIDSLEFVDQENLIILWRMARFNSLGDIPRNVCTKTNEEINQQIETTRDNLLTKTWSDLAKSISPALNREFKRRNFPQKGDRPVMDFMVLITRNTIQAEAQKLPENDQGLFLDMFSYGKPPKSLQEYCERNWVSSRAVQDSKLENSKNQISAELMRRTMIPTAVGEVFAKNDEPVRIAAPKQDGFKQGSSSINLPLIGIRNRLEGTMTVHVDLDAENKPRVSLVSSDLKPAKLVAIDKSVHDAATVMLKQVDAFFKAGKFAGSTKSFDTTISWKKP